MAFSRQTSHGSPPPRNYFGLAVGDVQYNGIEPKHDKLNPALLTGAVALEIEVLSPVHIGSGSFGLADGRMVKETLRHNGVPVIPGSSIKGTCRQIHESLTCSASPFERDPPRDQNRPSASAGLFGRLGFAGRVSFDDAVSCDNVTLQIIRMSVPYQPQKSVGRRFYGPLPLDADQPGCIDTQALPSGTKLVTHLRFRNVQDYELDGVLLSLGVDRFTPKLGAGKYDRFGWVRFRILRYRLRKKLIIGAPKWTDDAGAIKTFYDPARIEGVLPPEGRAALRKLEQRVQVPPAEKGGTP